MWQVNSNGFVSFGYPYIWPGPRHFPIHIGVHFAVVAPFWSDVDISSGVGNIYYHLYGDAQSPLALHASEELTSFTGHFMADGGNLGWSTTICRLFDKGKQPASSCVTKLY